MDTPTGHGQAFHRAGASGSPLASGQSPLATAGSLSALLQAQSIDSNSSPQANGVASSSENRVKASEPHFAAIPSSPPTSHNFSTSPSSNKTHNRARTLSIPGNSSNLPRQLTPFDTGDIKILLLENVSQGAVDMLKEQGYQVDFHTKAWTEQELVDKIGDYHVIGIRSKTKLTANVFRKAQKVSRSEQTQIRSLETQQGRSPEQERKQTSARSRERFVPPASDRPDQD